MLPNAAAFIVVFVAYNMSFALCLSVFFSSLGASTILVLFSVCLMCVHVYLAIVVRGEHTYNYRTAFALLNSGFCLIVYTFYSIRNIYIVYFFVTAVAAAAAVIVTV